MKRVWAVLAVFVSWSILDIIIHGVLLGKTYAQQPQLWRAQPDMKMWLIYVVTLLSAIVFVEIYQRLISQKSLKNALTYGILFGFGAGVSMGYGTYSVQPIPYYMAFVWFIGTWIEALVAGILVGYLIKE